MKQSRIYSLLAALLLQHTHADPLSATDMEQLREKLKSMMNDAREKATDRYADAARDFLAGMQSDDAAYSLYLKCVEKADFIDQDKKEGEFNLWKRKYDDDLRNKSFREALRHQLHWLVISMRASSHPDQIQVLSNEAEKVLEGVFKNMEPRSLGVKEPTLKIDHDKEFHKEPLLEREVLQSAFARAYKLGDLKVENWPTSPFKINEIYDRAIMPPLRNAEGLSKLSQAWDTRIAMLEKKQQYAYGFTDEKQKGMQDSARMENFSVDTLPDLYWKKEVDLFKAGDQKAGALRMLKHIEKYISNNHARSWVEEFQTLMQPKPAGATQ